MALRTPKDPDAPRQLERNGYFSLVIMFGVLIWSLVSKTYLFAPVALAAMALATAMIVIARRQNRRL